MIVIFIIVFILLLYLVIPKSTIMHELLRVPGYNFKAQFARRNEMIMEKHSFANHRKQYFYLFLPKDQKVTRDQVIIYYHGGGWTFGTPMMFRCNAQIFVDQGYAVIMPSYRRLPFYQAPDMQADAQAALKMSVEILEKKGLGDKKLIISGLSAGGHLAALTALNQSTWSAIGVSRNRLAGLMFFAAPLDLNKMAVTPVIWRLAGRRGSKLFKASNPLTYLEKGDPTPVFILHGTKDGLVNYKSSISFIEKRGDQNLKFYTIENGTHLDSGNWIFEDGKIRRMVLEWVEHLR